MSKSSIDQTNIDIIDQLKQELRDNKYGSIHQDLVNAEHDDCYISSDETLAYYEEKMKEGNKDYSQEDIDEFKEELRLYKESRAKMDEIKEKVDILVLTAFKKAFYFISQESIEKAIEFGLKMNKRDIDFDSSYPYTSSVIELISSIDDIKNLLIWKTSNN